MASSINVHRVTHATAVLRSAGGSYWTDISIETTDGAFMLTLFADQDDRDGRQHLAEELSASLSAALLSGEALDRIEEDLKVVEIHPLEGE